MPPLSPFTALRTALTGTAVSSLLALTAACAPDVLAEVPRSAAQSPEGRHLAWLLEVANEREGVTSEGEIEDHFSPRYLEQMRRSSTL